MAEGKRALAGRINDKLNLRDLDLVESIISEVGPCLLDILMEGKELHILDLGRFFTKYIENRHNPKTMEPVPPMFIPKFIPSHVIRTTVKTKKADYFTNEKLKDDLKNS